MTLMTLTWRQPDPPAALAWRGPDQTVMAAIARGQTGSIAAVIGPAGTGGGGVTYPAITCGVAVSKGQPLAIDRVSGLGILADPSYNPKAFVIGLADRDAGANASLDVMTGPVTLPDWTAITGTALLSPGQAYFLTAAGHLGTTPPSAPLVLTNVGTALTTTTMLIEPQPPILL